MRLAHPDPATCRPGWLHAVVSFWLDPDETAHRGGGQKGWAISPIAEYDDGIGFEVGIVDDRLLDHLHAGVGIAAASGIRLGPLQVQLDTTHDPGGVECLGAQAWDELADTPRCGGVDLEFRTPTGFRAKNHWSALPTFARVFGSYRSRWRAFAPELEPRLAFDEVVDASPVVALETGVFNLLGREVRGTTGRLVFELVNATPDQELAVAALAAVALYGGTGGATTSGMGVTDVTFLAPTGKRDEHRDRR